MTSPDNLTSISITTGTMIRGVLIICAVLLLWVLRDFVLIILTSIVIASFVDSAIPFFERRKISRIVAVPIIYVTSFLLLVGAFYIFAPLLITELYNLSVFFAPYAPDNSILNYFNNEAFSGAKDIVSNLSGNLSFGKLLDTSSAFIQNLSAGFIQTLSVAFGSIFNVVLIVIIAFYLSIQEKGIENFLRIVLPSMYEEYVVDLWNRSRRKIGLWVRGQMLSAFLVAVLMYLALSLIGIPYALLLALIAGVMTMVPYGIFIALIPAVSFSYISGGLSSALIVTAVYVIISQFESFLFTPLIINKVVGLSPLVVILAVLMGYELGGFWGIVLSVPVAVVVMEIMNDVEKKRLLAKKNE